MRPTQIVEALLFSSDAPLNSEEIARADDSLDEDVVERCIEELTQMYLESERAFEIKQISGGYQILTHSVYAPYLEKFDTVPKSSRLSTPALETLAIVAYRQPIGRIDIEYVRGVSSAGVIRTLQDRELVEVVGRGDGLGRPLLYGTTNKFLEHFGFSDLDGLPRTKDLPVVLKGEDVTDSADAISEETEDQECADGRIEPEISGDEGMSSTHSSELE
ncbi:MAG TPA: SMC-Scp complex subunit ScpB [Gemmatimonadetes bacterium]|jgi:segregation and condensation protein B|nr:SMC-Scp complex subunit ScpB [Gemmatimonadota bacterium]